MGTDFAGARGSTRVHHEMHDEMVEGACAVTYLEKALHQQAKVLREALTLDVDDVADVLRRVERVHLVGTGSSQHAAELGAWMLRRSGLDASWWSSATAADTVDWRDHAVIVLSHTGETAFARTVRDRVLGAGTAQLITLTGPTAGWPEALRIAPREKAETYTFSYTAALLVLAKIAGRRGAPEFTDEALARTVDAVADAVAARPPDVSGLGSIVLAGSGPAAVTAREGALKLREAARLHAVGYEAEYLLHGSAVPLGAGDELILLQPAADATGLVGALGEAAAAEAVTVHEVSIDADLDPVLLQLPLTVQLQTVASRLAYARAHDPDVVITGAWRDDRLWSFGGPKQ
jgi:glutamine---fructose-6-phosphate transaminase (isomerizing)